MYMWQAVQCTVCALDVHVASGAMHCLCSSYTCDKWCNALSVMGYLHVAGGACTVCTGHSRDDMHWRCIECAASWSKFSNVQELVMLTTLIGGSIRWDSVATVTGGWRYI